MRVTASALGGFLMLSPLAVSFYPGPSWSRALPARAVTACVDPKATLVLSDATLLARHTLRWRQAIARRGRCDRIVPDKHWEPIFASGTLLLMRRSPPQPGRPPLYFRARTASLNTAPRSAISQAALPALVARLVPANRLAMPPASIVLSKPLSVERFPPAPLPRLSPSAARVPPRFSDPTILRRGYAIGFTISVCLIILALSIAILLLRLLFRRRAPIVPTQPVPFSKMPRLAARNVPLFKEDAQDALAGVEHEARTSEGRLDQSIFSFPPPLASYSGEQVAARTRLSTDLVRQCASLLQKAGWFATVRQIRGGSDTVLATDVVARRRGRILTLRCVPVALIVDEEVIDQACLTREREQADVAAIVSAAPFTFNARKLALETGIELLHPDQLEGFARSIA